MTSRIQPQFCAPASTDLKNQITINLIRFTINDVNFKLSSELSLIVIINRSIDTTAKWVAVLISDLVYPELTPKFAFL